MTSRISARSGKPHGRPSEANTEAAEARSHLVPPRILSSHPNLCLRIRLLPVRRYRSMGTIMLLTTCTANYFICKLHFGEKLPLFYFICNSICCYANANRTGEAGIFGTVPNCVRCRQSAVRNYILQNVAVETLRPGWRCRCLPSEMPSH